MGNPWMSLWLSTARSATSAWSGVTRRFWTAQTSRQQRAMVDEMTRHASELWMGGLPQMQPARVPARLRRG